MDQKAQAPHASPAPDAPPKPVLDYPFEAPPQRGQTLEVAPGVLWIRMPLPYALDHINLWAIDDGNGWAIVDTGARTDEGVATWRELFSKSSDGRSLTRVLVTHMHPDHVGLAGWLTRKFHVPLYMTRLEYLNCRVVVSDCSREAPPDAIAFYRRAGWSDGALESYRARFGNFGKHIHALPDSYRRLHDGEERRIGGHLWRVVVGSGHSPEHASLYCPDLKLLISGDQVLPASLPTSRSIPWSPTPTPWPTGWNRWKRSGAKCPTMCWSCLRTAIAFAACMRASIRWWQARNAPTTGCWPHWPSRGAPLMSSAPCSRAPSASPARPCWAWPRAKAWPASTI
jgi:glyoxylase-like metal-dependent hydrolase (beta-lactamase superfamily II)